MRQKIWFRTLQAAVGMAVFAFGIYLLMKGSIGMDPWDVLELGLSDRLHLSYGLIVSAIGVALILINLLLKEKIGITTLLDALIVGKSVDFFLWWDPVMTARRFWPGLGILVAGLFVMALAQYLYLSVGLCAGPRDAFFVAVGRRLPRIPIGVVNMGVQAAVLGLGCLAGGPVGIGTAVSAFGIGLAQQVVFPLFRFEPRAVDNIGVRDLWRMARRPKPASGAPAPAECAAGPEDSTGAAQ